MPSDEAVQDAPLDAASSHGSDPELAVLVRQLIARVGESDDEAVGCAAEGTMLLDVEVDGARYVFTRLPSEAPTMASSLSPREQEIARMVSQGLTNKAIASVLEISTWTVSTHLRRIFAKIGVSTRAAMVAKVVRPAGDLGPPGNTRPTR